MTGPVHSVETTYDPHRNLITGVTNRAKSRTGILSGPPSVVHRDGTTDPQPTAPSLADPSQPSTKNEEPGTILSSYTYANDLLGRRETISQGGSAFAMLPLGENKIDVAYNDRSEVISATTRRGDTPVARQAYAYDGIGNRTSARSSVGPSAVGSGQTTETKYESNALNQYSSIRENSSPFVVQNSSFDLDGNLIEDARNTYTWNADNNLIRVDSKDGKLRLDYTYDYQSRRTVRVETKEPGTKNEEQRTTYYLYDDWNLVAELSQDSVGSSVNVAGEANVNHQASNLKLYTWGRDLSGSLQGAGGVGGLLAITDQKVSTSPEPRTKDKTRFVVFDANGNIGQLLDETGLAVAAYAYDPFGNVTEMAGAEAAGNPWRFSTKPVEEAMGWLYYGFRYYMPTEGRWASRDPIEEEGGVNLYGFVGNDGVGGIDRLGLIDIFSMIFQDQYERFTQAAVYWAPEPCEGESRGIETRFIQTFSRNTPPWVKDADSTIDRPGVGHGGVPENAHVKDPSQPFYPQHTPNDIFSDAPRGSFNWHLFFEVCKVCYCKSEPKKILSTGECRRWKRGHTGSLTYPEDYIHQPGDGDASNWQSEKPSAAWVTALKSAFPDWEIPE